MTNHPITPPDELVQQWCDSAALSRSFKNISIREVDVLLILEAFQAGADQELEACCKWFTSEGYVSNRLRNHRRPKPLSLKEKALRELGDVYSKGQVDDTTYETIANALEALPNE